MNVSKPKDILIEPYGGRLVSLIVPEAELEAARARAGELPRIQISARNVCDLELLATGAFSPLNTFMGRSDYERVLEEMRLTNDFLFPLPITLTVTKDLPARLDDEIALSDQHNNILATMRAGGNLQLGS